MHGRPQIIQVMIEDLFFGRDGGGLGERPRLDDGDALPAQLLAGVRLPEELFWDLAEVVDKTDGRVFLERVVDTGEKTNSVPAQLHPCRWTSILSAL